MDDFQASATAHRARRIAALLVMFLALAGVSLLLSGAALAHEPDGYAHVVLVEGQDAQSEDAGDLYSLWDGDVLHVHWHLTGDFASAVVTNQFACAGEYSIDDANARCKPGQVAEGEIYFPSPVGSDDWTWDYEGEEDTFQIHLSVTCECGNTLLANVSAPAGGTTTGGTTGGTTTGGTTGGTTTGGTTGQSTTTGTTTGDTTPPEDMQVLGKTIKKPLARTASEATVAGWLAAMMLLIGGTIRYCTVEPQSEIVYSSDSDELVRKSLDLVMRLVRSRR